MTLMNWKNASLQKRLYLIAAIVLLVGLGSALLIYLTAEDASEEMLIYEFEHSKLYRHNLELYGGKINVLASEFIHWFEGLWHGKSLALTITCITVIISLGFLFVAYHLPSAPDSAVRDGDDSDLSSHK
jgi:hypothetical protein